MLIMSRIRVALTVAIVALFTTAGWHALGFHPRARYLPLAVSVVAVLLSVVSLLLDLRQIRRNGVIVFAEGADTPRSDEHIGEVGYEKEMLLRAAYFFGWILLFVLLMYVLGVPAASAVFLVMFLRREGEMGWVGCVLSVAAVLALLFYMSEIFNLEWPASLLSNVMPR